MSKLPNWLFGRRCLVAGLGPIGPHGHAPDPLAGLMRDAGFADAAHVADRATFMGHIAYHRAVS